MTKSITDLLDHWETNDGKPYKGNLIDWSAYEAEPDNIGCMCAQGQVLALYGGWEPQRLRDAAQDEADTETAKLLNISRAHAILLRSINDKQDGAPSIVLTDPGKVLGDQWSQLLDFWWAIDQFDAAQWAKVVAACDATRVAAWGTAWDAARDAAGAAAGDAARDAAWDAAGAAAWNAAKAAARDTAGAAAGAAAWKIQGFYILTERGRDAFFLPMFGWASPAEIPARPADYGNGVVPQAQSLNEGMVE